jgi:peptidoglycan hydrolase-like protein with peptidoglycan-binding domain
MNPLSIGASGRAVAFLQARIGARSDGSFGPLTQAALKAAQAHSRLPATGVYDALTNKVFTQRTAGIIDTLALQLGVEPAALDALIKVETAGAGFLDDGRPKILLERHYVYRLVPVQLRSSMPTDICNETPGG